MNPDKCKKLKQHVFEKALLCYNRDISKKLADVYYNEYCDKSAIKNENFSIINNYPLKCTPKKFIRRMSLTNLHPLPTSPKKSSFTKRPSFTIKRPSLKSIFSFSKRKSKKVKKLKKFKKAKSKKN